MHLRIYDQNRNLVHLAISSEVINGVIILSIICDGDISSSCIRLGRRVIYMAHVPVTVQVSGCYQF